MNQKSLLFALIALTGVIVSDRATAQTFQILHQFTAVVGTNRTNTDGAFPYSLLTASGNILYGTTQVGGSGGGGTVFAINLDGSGFTNLHTFSGSDPKSTALTNNEGSTPSGALALVGKTLYGTTEGGGSLINSGGKGKVGGGTIFGINTDGSGFTILHAFTGMDGASPQAGLIVSGSALYGTTAGGGANSGGTIYVINTDGSGFAVLHAFTGMDGASPQAGLIVSGSTLYGTTSGGGSNGRGTLFAINTDGTGFTNLYSFTGGLDGSIPAGVTLSGNVLYGVAMGGGYASNSNNNEGGTLYSINSDGTGFTNLFEFYGASYEGAGPIYGVLLSGGTLYGTTEYGGFKNNHLSTSNSGSVFAIATNAQPADFSTNSPNPLDATNLYTFSPLPVNGIQTDNLDGAEPIGLISVGNTLYGMTIYGGSGGTGIIYSLSKYPPVTNTISVIASPSAGGIVSGGGAFVAGGIETVTATNRAYYSFADWSVNGTNVSTNASYSFNLTGDITLVANFNQSQYTIGVGALPQAGGTVSGGGTFGGGSTNLVTAVANSGYSFKSWTTNGTSVSTLPNYTFTLKGNEMLEANFTQITNTISLMVSPVAGGSVSGGGTFPQGSLLNVTAMPKAGYSFTDWTVNGINVSSSPSYLFTLTGNEVLVANFTQTKFSIEVSSSASTEGSVSGGGVFVAGGSHTVKATPKHGFKFVGWSGTATSSSASYTLVLTGNEVLVANFQPVSTR